MTTGRACSLAAALFAIALPAFPADHGEAEEQRLDTITVVSTGVSNMNAASAGDVDQGQIAGVPLLRPAAVLENVPGLRCPG